MLDIVQALEWIRDNSACFGGDPSRGSTRDDMKMMMLSMPWFGTLDAAGLEQFAEATFGALAADALAAYRRLTPDASPTEIACRFVTDRVMWSGAIDWAERKIAGGGAPVYVYRFDYETPALEDRCTMVFDVKSRVEIDPDAELRAVYDRLRSASA
jgi:carboxylesterase type B